MPVRDTVAFGIDGCDRASAWSVRVEGKASDLESDDAVRACHTRVKPWTPDPTAMYVRIQACEVTGRRFGRGRKTETIWYR